MKNKGITLIALVITIIILLILAAISINALTESGLFGKAKQAKIETERQEVKEQVQLAVLASYGEDGKLDYEQLENNLNKIEGIKSNVPSPITEDSFPITVNVKGYDVTIQQDGTVTVAGEKTDTEEIKEIKPGENAEEVEGTTFSTDYGKIEVIWLKGTTDEVIEKPNSPVLESGEGSNKEAMTAVKWNESNNIEEMTNPDGSWYNYTEGKWANARTKNESYFVWIPRYAYRITYYESETSTEPTGYYDGYGQWDAKTGNIRLALDSGVNTVKYKGNKYIIHPAFEDNVEMGGWSNKLTGFWFAKFEMSGETAETLKSTYGVQSQRNQTIGTQYTNARTATYGYKGTIDEFDNKTSFMNSHMVKNSEWGAVSYLAHSVYGVNGKYISVNNNSYYYTGGGSGTAYVSNINRSTSGNVYGIYDLCR